MFEERRNIGLWDRDQHSVAPIPRILGELSK